MSETLLNSDGPGVGAEPLSTQVFVGGLPRSGTTLLAQLLSQSPVVTGLHNTGVPMDEGQHLQDVYLPDDVLGAGKYGRTGANMRWAYHPGAHLTEADAREVTNAGGRMLKAWCPYLTDRTRPVLLEKSPSNVVRCRFLQASFGDARFAIITRHPVVQALAVMKWGNMATRFGFGLEKVVDHWLTAMDYFTEDYPHLKVVFVTSYEELMADPRSVLANMTETLGMPAYGYKTEPVHEASGAYIRYWGAFRRGRLISLSVLRERRHFSRLQQELERLVAILVGRSTAKRIDKLYGERMHQYGYELGDLTHCSRVWG